MPRRSGRKGTAKDYAALNTDGTTSCDVVTAIESDLHPTPAALATPHSTAQECAQHRDTHHRKPPSKWALARRRGTKNDAAGVARLLVRAGTPPGPQNDEVQAARAVRVMAHSLEFRARARVSKKKKSSAKKSCKVAFRSRFPSAATPKPSKRKPKPPSKRKRRRTDEPARRSAPASRVARGDAPPPPAPTPLALPRAAPSAPVAQVVASAAPASSFEVKHEDVGGRTGKRQRALHHPLLPLPRPLQRRRVSSDGADEPDVGESGFAMGATLTLEESTRNRMEEAEAAGCVIDLT